MGEYYEYMCTWVDDLLYAGKDAEEGFYESLHKSGYKLKGIGFLKYHPGGDFKRVKEPEEVLTWGSTTYIKKMLAQYEQLFGTEIPKREIHTPLEPGDHPKLDESPLCDNEEHAKYMTMVCALQWTVSLGWIDIITSAITMSRCNVDSWGNRVTINSGNR